MNVTVEILVCEPLLSWCQLSGNAAHIEGSTLSLWVRYRIIIQLLIDISGAIFLYIEKSRWSDW